MTPRARRGREALRRLSRAGRDRHRAPGRASRQLRLDDERDRRGGVRARVQHRRAAAATSFRPPDRGFLGTDDRLAGRLVPERVVELAYVVLVLEPLQVARGVRQLSLNLLAEIGEARRERSQVARVDLFRALDRLVEALSCLLEPIL